MQYKQVFGFGGKCSMKASNLIELNNTINDASISKFIYSKDGVELLFDSVITDFLSRTVILRSGETDFLRTPVIKSVFIDEELHSTFIFIPYENECFKIQYIKQNT